MKYKGFTYTPTPKTAWDSLSMQEKSEMMKVAVRNDITDLKTIREKYNEFAEGGYLDWKERASKYKHLDIDNDRTYDYEGWYNENPQRAWDFLNDNPDAHFDDKYKTAYYPTFSTQSRYSGVVDPVFNPDGLVGGTWNKQGSVFTMSPDGYRGPVSMDERAWYLMNAEDNGVQLREADNSLPVFDGIPLGGVLPNVTVTGNKFAEGGIHIKPENRGKFTALKKRTGHSATWFKEHGTPAQKKMATFALNARHWKHGLGGNLFDGITESSQQMQIGRPFYSYDWNGNRITDASGNPILNYNVTLPEVTIIPDSKLSPAEKNYRQRQRQVNLADYAEQQARDYTIRQSITAQREWENSPQKKVLDLGIAAAQGIGMASDVVSPFFGGIPVYSGLKGAQALDRATSTNELGDYADAALWLSPTLAVAGKKVYDAAKPAVQGVFQKGTPAAEWAEVPQLSVGNGMIPNGASEEIKPAIERGRNTLIDWLESSFYKDRLKDEPLYRVADDVVADASAMVRDVPVEIKERSLLEDFANGVTSPRLFTEKVLPDGTIIRDFNTGLDVAVASDLGENADDVTLHELLHYMTSNSKGTPISKAGEKIIEHGWFAPTDAYYNAIGIINRTRGKGWQNYVMDQNDALLPKYDAVAKMVMEEPNKAKAALIRTGRTAEQAEAAVNSLRERYSYWYDIQEQRAHLQELFLSKIKPHLKNPNDAAEIETFLTEHPEILENSSPYKYIQEVRPGSLKQYARYFASALGTVPFISNFGNNE